ncbi:MAG TPA: YkuS family protein [Ruminiclostridium sp.]|nr:YkuS family protein [Ruminiclostridium sp.]
MIVAVQSNLSDIADGLKKRGYTVVDLYAYKKPVDAVVYQGKSFDFSAIVEENVSSVEGSGSGYGVFIVCSNGKSIEEIDYMLKTRCYSSFF